MHKRRARDECRCGTNLTRDPDATRMAQARIRKVRVPRDLGTQVEVNAGVKEGDRVILNPAVNLPEGGETAFSSSYRHRI